MNTNRKSIKCVGTNYVMGLPKYPCRKGFIPNWMLRHEDDMYVFTLILTLVCFSSRMKLVFLFCSNHHYYLLHYLFFFPFPFSPFV